MHPSTRKIKKKKCRGGCRVVCFEREDDMRKNKRIICAVLCLILISMLGLTGCGTDKEQEGVITKDLKLKDVQVDMDITESDRIKDTSNGAFVLLHSFEESDVSMYYYEEYKETAGFPELYMEYVAIEKDGIYHFFVIPFDDSGIHDSDINTYKCYDYDGDGTDEIVAVFRTGQSDMYEDWQLVIFDYNDSKGSYDMCSLGIANVSNAIKRAVVKFYGEQYGIQYKQTSYDVEDDAENYFEYDFMGCSEQKEINMKYGNYFDISLSDDGGINMSVSIFEELDSVQEPVHNDTTIIINDFIYSLDDEGELIKEEVSFIDVGLVNCDIKYIGDGSFLVNASEYKEDTTKRGYNYQK